MDARLTGRLQTIVNAVFNGAILPASQATGGATIHRFLDGSVAPRLKTVQQMADGFGVPIEYLLGFANLPEMKEAEKPEWFYLIKRYHRLQQQHDRKRIAQADVALIKGLNLLDMPILSSLLAVNGRREEQIDAIRKTAEAETALVHLAATQLKTDKPKSTK